MSLHVLNKRGKLIRHNDPKDLERELEKERALDEQAIPLGGSKKDIAAISFNLSIGDIAKPITLEDCPRKQYVFDCLTADPWGELEEMLVSAEQFWAGCIADLEKLKSRTAAGEAVRIWVDATPEAACGLLFVAQLLEKTGCQVTIVSLPRKLTRPDGAIVEYIGWGEVKPQLFGSLLESAVILSQAQLSELAEQWSKLQQENAPLRAVQGERVASVGVDYYDDVIRKEYPKKTCCVAELIGNVLVKHRLGIGDWFVAQRIRALLESGELELRRNDPSRFYNSTIARAK